jgi:hypothetical protein
MRKIPLLLLVIALPCFTLSLSAAAIVSPHPAQAMQPGTACKPANLLFHDITKLSPRQFEKLTGKKLHFTERIAYKLLQWKIKKKQEHPEKISQKLRRKLGWISFILGLGSVLLLGITGLVAVAAPIALMGAILGLIAIKGNGDPGAILGMVFSGLALLGTIFFYLYLDEGRK